MISAARDINRKSSGVVFAHKQAQLIAQIVQSQGWLSIKRFDAVHLNNKTRRMFQGAWRDLEPDATINPLEVTIITNQKCFHAIRHTDIVYYIK